MCRYTVGCRTMSGLRICVGIVISEQEGVITPRVTYKV